MKGKELKIFMPNIKYRAKRQIILQNVWSNCSEAKHCTIVVEISLSGYIAYDTTVCLVIYNQLYKSIRSFCLPTLAMLWNCDDRKTIATPYYLHNIVYLFVVALPLTRPCINTHHKIMWLKITPVCYQHGVCALCELYVYVVSSICSDLILI